MQQPDIAKSLQITGWMSALELIWLAERAQRSSVIVEVGSYLGRSTRSLGDNTQGIVYAVDTWNGPLSLIGTKTDSFYSQFCDNVEDLLEKKRIVPCSPEDKFLKKLEPDFVFIDGDHSYDAVKLDILTWKPRIKKGGILSGHDFGAESVTNAVLELLKEPKQVPETQIWYVNV